MRKHPYAPDPVMKSYHDIRDEIQDGDLFFFRGHLRSSRFFEWLTNSYYSHVATVARWGGRLMILQAESVGVQAIPLSVAVGEYPGRADWYRLRHEAIPGVDQKLPLVLDEARTDLGLKFSAGDVVRSLFRWVRKLRFRDPVAPRGLFCAEFVERSFRIGGVPLRVDADGRHARPDILCWPQDLAVSPLVAYQATVVHDPRVAVPRDRDDVPVPSTVPAISAT